MTSRIRTDDAEISRLLNETSEEEIQGSDSETEDNLLEDDVQSDTEDYDVSTQPVVDPLNAENVSKNDSEPSESASPSVPSYIIMPQRQILRGKNDHCWTATKGRTSGRDVRIINAYIIYCDNVLSKKEKPLGRRDFMKKLSNSLMTPWMEARQQMLTLPTNIKEKIGSILPERPAEPATPREGVPELKKRKYCAFFPSKIRRMTKTMCDSCKIPFVESTSPAPVLSTFEAKLDKK